MKRKSEKQEIYRTLTQAGIVLCAILGLGFEILLFLVIGIHFLEVSVVILGFLWLLSGILVSGALRLAASVQDKIKRNRLFHVVRLALGTERRVICRTAC
ncbi:MAG: hypothetical protein LUD12_02430 [Lachnospiraceae bacterium]|nr:hypothetical protein [Lachnospiraceae bacterium]